MAAVTKVDPTFVSPVGYEVVLRGRATVDLEKGDPVVIDKAAADDPRWDTTFKKATAETFIHGVVIKKARANGTVEVLAHGEIDGFAGLPKGDPLSVVGGNIDTTAPAAGVHPQLVAINASRILVRI